MPVKTTPTTFQKIFYLFTFNGKKELYWLLVAVVMMAVLDTVGVASIFPFLHVISNPEVIQTNAILNWVFKRFEFSGKDAFLVALGMVSFFIMVANNFLRAVISMTLIRFTWLKRATISERLLSKYLYEPYVFFLNRNTSELTAYLASEVARVVSSVLIPCMEIFAKLLTGILIIALLFVVDPGVAMVVLVVIGGGYGLIYAFVRKKLLRIGTDVTTCSKRIFKALNEVFGGIKDVKLLGKEDVFIERYADPMRKSVDCYCLQFLIDQFPRYAFEVLAFGGILLITIYLVEVKKDYQQIIPMVGLYALAAYRLMPALQQIYNNFTLVRFGRASLDVIYEDYSNCIHRNYEKSIRPDYVLPFTEHIELRNVTFQYPNAQGSVAEDFNLTIKANTTVGLVGSSGAGKTTLVDILLGLLHPSSGEVVIDGTTINDENLRHWQANIGYVPQSIYLCDDTIARNIAFGVSDKEVDHNAMHNVTRLANIHDFVKGLPSGYETEVGERGVRLSGGQRQRIGIARALYHNPSVLVFDEATSALDGITEDTILEAIHNLAHKKTIIIIAHRLSTVKECDIIYLLEQGKIIAQGTYRELLTNNQQFRRMAKISAEGLIV